MEVGVRDLKNNLSRYLACVSAGAEVIVTNRGHSIAKITPAGTERTLDRLIAETLAGEDVVLVAGDGQLCQAAASLGLAVARLS